MSTVNKPLKIDPDALIAVIDAGCLVTQPSPPSSAVISQETSEQAESRRLRTHLVNIWSGEQYRPHEDKMTLHQLLVDELARRTKKDVGVIARVPEEKLREIFKRSYSSRNIRDKFRSSAELGPSISLMGVMAYTSVSLGWAWAIAFTSLGAPFVYIAGSRSIRAYSENRQNRRLGQEIEGLAMQAPGISGPNPD